MVPAIIHGCRQGGLKAVTRAEEEIVAQLNVRHRVPRYAVGKPIRVHLMLKKNNPQVTIEITWA